MVSVIYRFQLTTNYSREHSSIYMTSANSVKEVKVYHGIILNSSVDQLVGKCIWQKLVEGRRSENMHGVRAAFRAEQNQGF